MPIIGKLADDRQCRLSVRPYWSRHTDLVVRLCQCLMSATGNTAAVVDVKRKLSDDQCSGSIFSDVTVDQSARAVATGRQLNAFQLPSQSSQVWHGTQERCELINTGVSVCCYWWWALLVDGSTSDV